MPKSSGFPNKAFNPNTARTAVIASDQVVLANDLAKMNFKTISIRGKFGKLLGKLYIPFYIMIYGSRFHGKSTVALMFADELVKQHGYKVLYVANEEGAKGTMQEKVVRLGINSPIGIIEDYNPKLFRDYDVVFIDSTQTTDISHEEFKELKKQFPSTSFVIINQANRDGSSKGGTKWEHIVDAIIHIENKCATMEKNRFPEGSSETIKIF
jgi:predicted ATP-dependent serine protease